MSNVSIIAVLDASALLAYLQGEPGASIVAASLSQGAAISAVNWAETLTKLSERGLEPQDAVAQLASQGILNQALYVYPMDENLAVTTAQLRSLTRSFGLSLGDRACLALALQLNLPVLTTDQAWGNLNIGVSITLIR